jgi:hypothetical protein
MPNESGPKASCNVSKEILPSFISDYTMIRVYRFLPLLRSAKDTTTGCATAMIERCDVPIDLYLSRPRENNQSINIYAQGWGFKLTAAEVQPTRERSPQETVGFLF